MNERNAILMGLRRLALAATLLAPLSAPLLASAAVVQDPHEPPATPVQERMHQHVSLLKQLLGEAREAHRDSQHPAHEHVRALHRMIEAHHPGLTRRIGQGDPVAIKGLLAEAKKALQDADHPAHEHVAALHGLIRAHHPELFGGETGQAAAPVVPDRPGKELLTLVQKAMRDPASPAHQHLVALREMIRRRSPEVIEALHHGTPSERRAMAQRILRRAGEALHDPQSPAHEHVSALYRLLEENRPEIAERLRQFVHGDGPEGLEQQPTGLSLEHRLARLEARLDRLERQLEAILERHR